MISGSSQGFSCPMNTMVPVWKGENDEMEICKDEVCF